MLCISICNTLEIADELVVAYRAAPLNSHPVPASVQDDAHAVEDMPVSRHLGPGSMLQIRCGVPGKSVSEWSKKRSLLVEDGG